MAKIVKKRKVFCVQNLSRYTLNIKFIIVLKSNQADLQRELYRIFEIRIMIFFLYNITLNYQIK